MAKVGHRLAEFVSAVVALLVTTALVDHAPVLFEIAVYAGQEVPVDLEFRKDVVPVDAVLADLAGNLYRVRDDLGMVREEGKHLLFALEILLLGVVETVFLIDVLAGVKTDQMVVSRTVFLVHEMDVVGGDDLHPHLRGEVEDLLVDLLLLFIEVQGEPRDLGPVEHHLEIVVIPEQILVPPDGLPGGIEVSCQDVSRNLSGQAGGTADEIVVVLLDDIMADPRLAEVETFRVGGRDDLHQILVSLVILGKEDQMVVATMVLVLELMVIVPCDIDLAADDRLDLVVSGLLVHMLPGELEELLDPVHVAMVCDGQGRHAEFLGLLEKGIDGRQTIQDGILRVDVKMDKGHGAKG